MALIMLFIKQINIYVTVIHHCKPALEPGAFSSDPGQRGIIAAAGFLVGYLFKLLLLYIYPVPARWGRAPPPAMRNPQ
jgi:hypothetical protein